MYIRNFRCYTTLYLLWTDHSLASYQWTDEGNYFFPASPFRVIAVQSVAGIDSGGRMPAGWTCQQRGQASVTPHVPFAGGSKRTCFYLQSFAHGVWCQLELVMDDKHQGRLNLRHGFRNSLWLPRYPARLLPYNRQFPVSFEHCFGQCPNSEVCLVFMPSELDLLTPVRGFVVLTTFICWQIRSETGWDAWLHIEWGVANEIILSSLLLTAWPQAVKYGTWVRHETLADTWLQ
jgi:hypothetical protein